MPLSRNSCVLTRVDHKGIGITQSSSSLRISTTSQYRQQKSIVAPLSDFLYDSEHVTNNPVYVKVLRKHASP